MVENITTIEEYALAKSANSLGELGVNAMKMTRENNTKDIFLRARAFRGAFVGWPKINGLNDIMRYDVRAFLKRMDEPVQKRWYLKDRQLKTISCHKVYHLNFVSRYQVIKPHKDKLHTRVRLVLNQKGIKRNEPIPL